MSEGKQKNSKGWIILPILFILVISGFILIEFDVHENYPRQYKKELNAILGEGNWECVNTERKLSRFARTTTKDVNDTRKETADYYKEWTISYRDSDDQQYKFVLSNHTHKISNTKRFFWDRKYISNRENFAMDIYQFIEDYACSRILWPVINDIFDPEDYAYGYTSLSDIGVAMNMSLVSVEVVTNEEQLAAIDPDTGFKLAEFTPEQILDGKNYYLKIEIRTQGAAEGKMKELDRKAAELNAALIDTYGPLATFEIDVYHFSEDENSKSSNAKRSTRYFAVEGQAVTSESEDFDIFGK